MKNDDIKSRFLGKSPLRESGLTLIELMIAMALGLVILAAVSQLFLTSKATYSLEEGMARTQEGGRFAMEFLAQDIRMAGFTGCNNASNGCPSTPTPPAAETCPGSGNPGSCCNNVQPADEASTFAGEGIRGYTYTGTGSSNLNDWSPALPDVFFDAGEVKAFTDVIVVQYGVPLNLNLIGNLDPSNGNIQVSNNTQISDNDVLMISDCKNTDIFRATTVSAGGSTIAHAQGGANPGNVRPHLGHTYGGGAEILKMVSRAYYIKDGAGGEPALWRKEFASGGAIGGGQELVQGVENMRFMYGVDTDIAARDWIANRYVAASDVVDLGGPGTTNWNHVVSLRLGLLLRTPTNVTQEADTRLYELADGVSIDPPDDFRRRQVYKTTIQLRNS